MNEVERWLQGLGLGGCAQAFAEQGIEFDLLSELGDDDLKALGVAQLGHRKRLLRAIAALNRAALPSPLATPVPPMIAPSVALREAERRQLTDVLRSGRLDGAVRETGS